MAGRQNFPKYPIYIMHNRIYLYSGNLVMTSTELCSVFFLKKKKKDIKLDRSSIRAMTARARGPFSEMQLI